MKKLLLLITICLLNSCGYEIIFYPRYSDEVGDTLDYWEHKKTKEKITIDIYKECTKNIEEKVKNIFNISETDDLYNYWEKQSLLMGECFYEKGYIFTGWQFSPICVYNSLRKIECKAFSKYR